MEEMGMQPTDVRGQIMGEHERLTEATHPVCGPVPGEIAQPGGTGGGITRKAANRRPREDSQDGGDPGDLLRRVDDGPPASDALGDFAGRELPLATCCR